MIDTMEKLQQRVAAVGPGYDWKQHGDVFVNHYPGGLVIFNYSPEAAYRMRWNWFERVSRGLILDSMTGEVVARPFDKFFNWLEKGKRASPGAILEHVSEKMDGSLGILYRYLGHYKIATRGSLDGPQAVWATKFLNDNYDLAQSFTGSLPENLTLLFEIIMPGNRIVVDYGNRKDLMLIGARDRFTGYQVPWFSEKGKPNLFEVSTAFGFSTPLLSQDLLLESIIDKAKTLNANREGYVLHYSDGSMWKIKGDRYVEIHRLLFHASYKRILDLVAAGTYKETMKTLPPDLRVRTNEVANEIQDEVHGIANDVYAVYLDAPHELERKDFALWVKKNHPKLAMYLFARLDGRDIKPMIFKKLRRRGRKK